MTDLKGATIAPPPPGVMSYSNGIISGDVHPRDGSSFANVTINGAIQVDGPLNGLGLTHCSFHYIETLWPTSNITIQACDVSPGDGGNFTAIALGNPGDNIVITDNLIHDVREGVHLTNGKTLAAGLNISYNEFRGIHRHGIEVQMQCDSAVCQGNLLHQWKKNDTNPPESPSDSHICISWACGPTKPGGSVVVGQSVNSRNSQILRNVIIQDGDVQWPMVTDAWKNCLLENMGDGNVVAGNYFKNGGACAYTFTRAPWTSQNNALIGLAQSAWNDETGASDAQYNWHDAPTVTNDRYYALNDPNQPAQPAAGPRVTPGVGSSDLPSGTGGSGITPSNVPSPTPTPTGTMTVTQSPNPGTLIVTLPGTSGMLSRKSTNGGDPFVKIATIASGQTSYTDVGPDAVSGSRMLAPTWRYAYQFNGDDGSTAAGGAQVIATPLPSAPVGPTLVSVINVYSDGTVKVTPAGN